MALITKSSCLPQPQQGRIPQLQTKTPGGGFGAVDRARAALVPCKAGREVGRRGCTGPEHCRPPGTTGYVSVPCISAAQGDVCSRAQ